MKNTFDTPVRRGRMVRWGVGITLAGFVAGGGLAAAMAGSATPPQAALASAGQAGQPGQAGAPAAELNTLLTASGTPATADGWRPLRRLRAAGGMYGTITFRARGRDLTVSFQRGTVQSVSGSNVVVRSLDGTSMTWQLVSNTVVREKGAKTSVHALADGQTVFVGGPVVSGAKDARLIVIRTGGAEPAPSPSLSSSPSSRTNTE